MRETGLVGLSSSDQGSTGSRSAIGDQGSCSGEGPARSLVAGEPRRAWCRAAHSSVSVMPDAGDGAVHLDRQQISHLSSRMEPSSTPTRSDLALTTCQQHDLRTNLPIGAILLESRARKGFVHAGTDCPQRTHASCPGSSRPAPIPVASTTSPSRKPSPRPPLAHAKTPVSLETPGSSACLASRSHAHGFLPRITTMPPHLQGGDAVRPSPASSDGTTDNPSRSPHVIPART